MSDNSLATISKESRLARRAEYESTLRELIVGGRKLTQEQINGRMAYAMQQDIDPISETHTITNKEGVTLAHTMAINGLRRKNQEALGNNGETIELEFVEFSKDRMTPDWAYAFECRLRDSVSYRNWQKRLLEIGKTLKEIMGSMDYQTLVEACGPAPVTVGIGIVYKSEINPWKDQNFNPIERAKKRAEVNARHHRFPTNEPVYDGDGGSVVIEGSFDEQPQTKPQVEAPKVEKPKRSEKDISAELGYFEDCGTSQNIPTLTPQPAIEPQPVTPVEIITSATETPTEATDAPSGDAVDPWLCPWMITEDTNTPYTDLETPQLSGRLNSIIKRKSGTEDDETRMNYIKSILAERNKKPVK